MAYATGDVIFGVPLVDLPADITLSEETEEYKEEGNEEVGFIRRYSGNHEESPSAFGLILDSSLESVSAFTRLKRSLAITPELQARYDELREALPDDVREDIQSLGEPEVFVLWSSS